MEVKKRNSVEDLAAQAAAEMTTWTFPTVFRNWPGLTNVAFRYLAEIYQELDRVPRVVTINLTHLALRFGKSDKSSKRALENIAECGLCKRVDSKTGAAGGVAYRFIDWRIAAADPKVKFPDVNQLRLSFIELVEEEGDREALGVYNGYEDSPAQQKLPEFDANHSTGCGDASGGMPAPAANHSTGCGDTSGGMPTVSGNQTGEGKNMTAQELASRLERERADRHAVSERSSKILEDQKSKDLSTLGKTGERVVELHAQIEQELRDKTGIYKWQLWMLAIMVETDRIEWAGRAACLSHVDVWNLLKSYNARVGKRDTNAKRFDRTYFLGSIANRIRELHEIEAGDVAAWRKRLKEKPTRLDQTRIACRALGIAWNDFEMMKSHGLL